MSANKHTNKIGNKYEARPGIDGNHSYNTGPENKYGRLGTSKSFRISKPVPLFVCLFVLLTKVGKGLLASVRNAMKSKCVKREVLTFAIMDDVTKIDKRSNERKQGERTNQTLL